MSVLSLGPSKYQAKVCRSDPTCSDLTSREETNNSYSFGELLIVESRLRDNVFLASWKLNRSYLSPQKEERKKVFPADLKLLHETPIASVIHEEDLEPMSHSMSDWITCLLGWCRDTDHEVVVRIYICHSP